MLTWKEFVSRYREENPNLSYKDALKQCGEIYREVNGTTKKEKKGGKKGGKKDPLEWKESDESSRIPAFSEFETIPHQPFDTIAGKQRKRGGAQNSYTVAPTPQQVKMGGSNMILVNGEHQDIDEGLKTMKAGKKKRGKGLFSDLGQGLDTVSSLLGLGLEKKKGGANLNEIVNYDEPMSGGSNELSAFASPTEFEATAGKKKRGKGLFSDLGQGLDTISSLLGMGNKKTTKEELLKDVEMLKRKIESM